MSLSFLREKREKEEKHQEDVTGFLLEILRVTVQMPMHFSRSFKGWGQSQLSKAWGRAEHPLHVLFRGRRGDR